jgi:hypothetical protein
MRIAATGGRFSGWWGVWVYLNMGFGWGGGEERKISVVTS